MLSKVKNLYEVFMLRKIFGYGIVLGSCLVVSSASAQSFPNQTAPIQSTAVESPSLSQAPEINEIANLESLIFDDEEVNLTPREICLSKCAEKYLKNLKNMGEYCDSLYFSWHRIICYKVQGSLYDKFYAECKAKC